MYTTLNEIRTHCPCSEGIETLMSNLGKIDQDEHISFETILKSNGVYDAVWGLRCAQELDVKRVFRFLYLCMTASKALRNHKDINWVANIIEFLAYGGEVCFDEMKQIQHDFALKRGSLNEMSDPGDYAASDVLRTASDLLVLHTTTSEEVIPRRGFYGITFALFVYTAKMIPGTAREVAGLLAGRFVECFL